MVRTCLKVGTDSEALRNTEMADLGRGRQRSCEKITVVKGLVKEEVLEGKGGDGGSRGGETPSSRPS